MKRFKIPIFTEEYLVNVIIGTREELKTALRKYTEFAPTTIASDFKGRGISYKLYPEKHPIIAIDGDLQSSTAIGTLAHEAIHAMDDLMVYLGIDAKETEFRAHGVSVILRTVLKEILKKK